MPDNKTRSQQKFKQHSTNQNVNKATTPSVQNTSENLLKRKSLETPKQKFDRLLLEGHKPKKKKIGDNNSHSSLEVISPTGTVEIDWVSHPEARSGCFIANVDNKEHYIDAKLEDEADNRIYSFSDQAQVKTHILPLGQVGDTAYFDVTNSATGETAVAKATTYGINLNTESIGGWIKNLFS